MPQGILNQVKTTALPRLSAPGRTSPLYHCRWRCPPHLRQPFDFISSNEQVTPYGIVDNCLNNVHFPPRFLNAPPTNRWWDRLFLCDQAFAPRVPKQATQLKVLRSIAIPLLLIGVYSTLSGNLLLFGSACQFDEPRKKGLWLFFSGTLCSISSILIHLPKHPLGLDSSSFLQLSFIQLYSNLRAIKPRFLSSSHHLLLPHKLLIKTPMQWHLLYRIKL